MIRNYNLLSGSRDTRLKNKNVIDVDISPTSFASKETKSPLSGWLNFLIVPMLLLFAGFTFAQTVTVPSANTNSGSVRQPLASWFGFERSAMIYTPAQIATTGSITNVRFYLNSVSSPAASADVRVYMKERTTTFAATSTYATETTGATLVFGPTTLTSASFTAASGGWYDITLATPFNYTGGSNNLEIIIETNATGTGSGETSTGKQFRYNTQASNQFFQTWATDNTPPTTAGTRSTSRPNVQLVFASSTVPPCATAFVPADIATGVGRNATLTWSGSGTSYDVYFGTATNPPFVGNVATTSYTPALMAANTTYYWKIVPKNSIGAAVGCTEQSFTTGTGYVYCLPLDTSGCASNDIVTGVALGTLSDTGQSCTPQHADRSAFQNAIPDLSQSTSSSTVSVTMGSDATQYSAVWIDFNQNGTFDTTEFFSLGTDADANGTSVIPITVPSGAVLGNTKMRVRGGQDSPLTSGHACGSSTSNFGTSRDYTVNIVGPPSCIAPSSLNATSITTTGANLNWTCTSCTGTFRVEYNTSPATFGGVGNVVTDPATSGMATGTLLPGTAYTFFVRQDCGGGNFSAVSSGSFTTSTPGESCVDAATITVAPDLASAVNTLLTTGTTSDGPDATCSFDTGNLSKKDRWIKFVAPSNGKKITITTVSGTITDMVMQVWSACPASGTAMGCSDDVNSLMPQLSLCQNAYVGGETYYVQLFPYSTTITGTFNIKIYEEDACPIPPDNDECAGIVDIEVGLPGSCPGNATLGTTINATASAGVVKTDCDLFGQYLDVMYKFNSGSATEINFNFTNLTGTNEFGLYDGCGTTYLGICESGSLSTIITGLDPSTDYWIIVWANNVGAQGNFSICLTALAAPVCVASPIAPVNGATNINSCVNTTLSWNAVPDAITYDVFLTAGGPATTLVSDDQTAFLGTNTYNAGLLLQGTTYSWKVIGKNSAGEPTGCSDFTFTTAGATVPGCVASPTAPVNASIICPGSTTFSWPAVATATTYDVYVDTVLVSDNQAGLTYTMDVSTLGSHTWMIVPANCVGDAVGCSIFTFSNTGGVSPSCVAAPTSPADASTTCSGNIYLAWPAAAGATSYDVYLDTVLVGDNTTNLYYIAGALAAGSHSWQIVPSNCYGDASGCATWTFTVGSGTAPVGDTFATAIDLGAITSTASVNGNNFTANCWNNDFNTTSTPVGVRPGNDVFYKFEITCAGTLDFGACTSSFDTYVSLLDATGALVAADDDSCDTPNGTGSRRTGVAVTPGIYYLVVDAYWAQNEVTLVSQGTFTLDISTTPTTSCSTVVNLKMFIEGYYIGGGAMTTVEDNQNFLPPTTTNVESIKVELHDTTAPYDVVATANAMLHTDGTATATFSSGPSGSYYIAVKTRNTVQTWSADPVAVGGSPITYNFTDASNKAYGDNMIMIETGIYAFFSGDLPEDGFQNDFIDGSDYSVWESDYNAFNNGVFATDLNGDGFVDGSDYSIWEGNYNQFIFAAYPF